MQPIAHPKPPFDHAATQPQSHGERSLMLLSCRSIARFCTMAARDGAPAVQTLSIAAGSSEEGGDVMATHYFVRPVAVAYRTAAGWRRVLALGVRHDDETYAVLITCPCRDTRTTWWVPRSQVRPERSEAASAESG